VLPLTTRLPRLPRASRRAFFASGHSLLFRRSPATPFDATLTQSLVSVASKRLTRILTLLSAPLTRNMGGWGAHANLPKRSIPIHSNLEQSVSFQSLAHSRAFSKISNPFFSVVSALFVKNARGGGTPASSLATPSQHRLSTYCPSRILRIFTSLPHCVFTFLPQSRVTDFFLIHPPAISVLPTAGRNATPQSKSKGLPQ
jgi:hypothetical protein